MNVKVADFELGANKPLLIIAGPCVIESWDIVFNTASALKDLSRELNFPLVFKASFDKANRTANDSFRGPGLVEGLKMLGDIKKKLGLPILSDVHEVHQCEPAGAVLDVIQIPAFLCRQTDLVVAAAKTGKAVNIKKGQFVAPKDILKSVEKVTSVGNLNSFVTERGTTFGYNNLIVDMRAIPMIQESGCPVVFDATHSVQLPSAGGAVSGGLRQYIPSLTKAAIAAGCQGLFMEVHPNPDKAKSDGATQIPLAQVRDLLAQWIKLHSLVQTQPEIVLPQQGHCIEPALIAK